MDGRQVLFRESFHLTLLPLSGMGKTESGSGLMEVLKFHFSLFQTFPPPPLPCQLGILSERIGIWEWKEGALHHSLSSLSQPQSRV